MNYPSPVPAYLRIPRRLGPWSMALTALVLVLPSHGNAQTPAAAAAAAGTPPLQEYRDFPRRHDGQPDRGRALFFEARTACTQCHAIDGRGSKTGPDLSAAGDKFARADLIRSILEPSANLLMGYATTVIETRSGERIEGIVKEVSEQFIILMGPNNLTQRITKSDIRQQSTSPTSLMPEGLHAAFTLEEFTDLIAFLESRKQSDTAGAHAAGTPLTIDPIAIPIALQLVHTKSNRFNRPVWFSPLPGLPGAFLIAEQTNAQIWLLERNESRETKSLFVDLRSEVFVTDTEGLLGVALHPRFRENRKYYYMHEAMEAGRRSMMIAERIARPDGRADSGRAPRPILRIDVPTEVHHGGHLLFGPEGALYIDMGDSGPQEDPRGHGQDLRTLSAKILRIDVDPVDQTHAYVIPRDNPFVRHPDPSVRREIWAYGFRQPWRFSFDPVTGHLWVADVGQDRFEEVGIVRAGENHGWNVYEGFELFSTRYRKLGEDYIPPIVSFRRRHGVSVTGGFVYRGRVDSPFYGLYICGDFESKRILAMSQKDGRLISIREIGLSPAKIVSFSEDAAGELYLVGYDLGMIYRLDLTQGRME